MTIKRLDHHGLVMGVIKDLGLIDQINSRLKQYDDEKISIGERVAAMIINGLGFTDQPLSLLPEFFEGLPVAELFDKPYEAKDFDRFSLSRALDRLYAYNESTLFAELAAHASQLSGIDTSRQSFDTTSFSLTGHYDQATDEACVNITHGYSKDHRPDLKQIITELLVSHDSGVPLIMKNWDGNASDNKIFEQRTAQLIESFQQGYTQHITADSKFYTEENSQHWDVIKFTTRVPETIKQAKNLIVQTQEALDWQCHGNGKLHYLSYEVNHYNVDQRWLVCHSEESKARAKKSVFKGVEKEKIQINKDLYHLQARRFSCQKDVNEVVKSVSKKWRYHRLTQSELVEHKKYTGAGRPVNKEPEAIEYQAIVEFDQDKELVRKAEHKKSCFILACNQTKEILSDDNIIDSYKDQQSVERGYRFLKDPHFFTSSFFLKKPERISALIMVMTLALLVYTIAQKRLRQAMLEQNAPLPDQNKKPSLTITLRRAFQLLRGIHLVSFVTDQVRRWMIEGMNEVKSRIIELMGGNSLGFYQVASATEVT